MRIFFSITLLVWPSIVGADHLKPRLFIYGPKVESSVKVQITRIGIVNQVFEDKIQVVGEFLFAPRLVSLMCEGDFGPQSAVPLKHGDAIQFLSHSDGCRDFMVLSEDVAAEMEERFAALEEQPVAKAEEPATTEAPKVEHTYVSLPELSEELPDIATVQARLSALGYDPGPIDGAYGRRTGDAVTAFRANHPELSRSLDRRITMELWQHLELATDQLHKRMATEAGEKSLIAAFWITRLPEGGYRALGGARAEFAKAERQFRQGLQNLAPTIDPGRTILLWITDDFTVNEVDGSG